MIVDTARDLAYGVNDQLRLNLTPRPWQLYDPGATLWWLVPSTEWPAYRHGKLVFSPPQTNPRKALLGLNDSLIHLDDIFTGVNVEKGYGQLAIEVNPALRRKPAQIIDKNWLWFSLVDGDGPPRFGRLLAELSASEAVSLYVVSSYAHDRELDPQPEHDAVMFSCHPRGLTAVLHRFPVGVLRGIEHATHFSAAAERLRAIDDYHWVDLYAGTHVARGEVDVKRLYRRLLSRFDEWVVEAPAKARLTRPSS